MNQRFCPKCQELGLKSRVYCDGTTTTLIGWTPYWDEDGNYVNDNPNKRDTAYHCSQYHRWSEISQGKTMEVKIWEDIRPVYATILGESI